MIQAAQTPDTITRSRGRPKKPRAHIDNTVDEKLFYLLASREQQQKFQELLQGPDGNQQATAYIANRFRYSLPQILARGLGLDEGLLKEYFETPMRDWRPEDWR